MTNLKNLGEICSRFGIAQYQIGAISELLQRTSIAGKRVLEIGGSNLPRELVIEELGAKEWVSVDIIAEGRYQLLQQSDHYSREGINSFEEGRSLIGTRPYIIIDGQIESAAPLPSAYFDLIVSIISFEHILAMASATRQVRRLKTRDGAFFTYHGPVWSSYCGHHIWVDDELNFNVDDAIPEFGHLLYSPPEMYHRLMVRYGHERAELAVLQMYHQPRVNRLHFEDYEKYFLAGDFAFLETTPYGSRMISDELQVRLETKLPGYKQFSAYGMIAFAT